MKTTRTRLALDLGSTSLGWALFRLNEQHEPTAIIKAGVRIFSDGRNPKDGASLAVNRREARAMRRRRDRLLKRKSRMMAALIAHGFFPAEASARKALESLDPYTLRDKGLREALTPAEFARALFHINQRRGFKSNRKTDKKDNDSGALKSAISHVRQQLTESGSQTVGQWLYRRLHPTQGEAQGTRARYRETPTVTAEGKKRIEKSYDLYIDRKMIEDEFDALWAVQAAHNPAVFNEAARWTLKDTLLFQRRLRPVKPGRCTLLPEEERAPLALPSTQRFRIYQEVNHLRVLDDGLQDVPLSLAQRDTIVGAMERKAKLSFDAIRTLLKLPGSVKFNLEDAKRQELKGNATSAALSKKELFGKSWFDLSAELQDQIVQRLVTDESEAELLLWLQTNTGVDEQHAQAIASAGLPEGHGSLSQAALARILPALQAGVVTYDKAVLAAGFEHHSQLGFEYDASEVGDWVHPSTGEIKPVFKQLPYYGKALQRHVAFGSGKPEDPEEKRYGKIANPTVHIGLNQVRVVVNALVRRYGRPIEVVIELARELKQTREQKRETQQRQADNQERNECIRKRIGEALRISPDNVKGEDIEKYKLWEELSFDVADRKCPYSGEQISAAMLLSEQVEIEHILPFSMTLDDSMNNKTVATRLANRIKGNRTPWQARDDFAAQGWSYDAMLHRAERMPLKKRYRFAADGYERWQGEDQGFLARALNDTRYLSRVTTSYVSLICPQGTRVIPGQMTALLRAKLGLNQVLGLRGEKNRNDHRHHAVDACVIGITDQGMLQRFARASADARQQALGRLVADMPVPWPTYREHVARAVSHIWVSHKPDHGHEGAMMEETSYGIRKDGSIKQRRKADGSAGREITNLIRIREQGQSARHGVDAAGQDLPYKGYVGGSNYCIEITVNEKGQWEGEVISTFEAYRIVRAAGLNQLRHPTHGQNGRPLAMRLVIEDHIRFDDEGDVKTMRIASINSAGRLSLAANHEANVDARNRDSAGDWRYTYKQAGSLHKAKARRITISPIGELRDPGFQG